jgi:hypothetical protein
MRIESVFRLRRRDGSLAIEALFTLPFAAVILLLVRFVFEGAMTRHEVSVHTRSSAVSAAVSDSAGPLACRHDGPFVTRAGVTKSVDVQCRTRDGEQGLGAERPILDALARATDGWRDLVSPFEGEAPFDDYLARGDGATAFDNPPFLSQQGEIASDSVYLSPSLEVFDQGDDPWKSGHDAVVWDELGGKTQKLFPNLFPSR